MSATDTHRSFFKLARLKLFALSRRLQLWQHTQIPLWSAARVIEQHMSLGIAVLIGRLF